MKKYIVALLMTVIALSPTHLVNAHVLITDNSNSKGAVLHIIPDDDPIAGEQATLYFDTQDQLFQSDSSVELIVKDKKGNEKEIDVNVNGTLVTANFMFPEQGVYDITYTITTNGSTYVFSQVQRVSRGTSSASQTKETYEWAEVLLAVSVISFALLFIIGFNRRKAIAGQSKL